LRDLFTSKEKLVLEVAEEKNRKATILNRKVVRPYAPRRYHVVLDISVEDKR
jgi:tRNA G37 N-methylase Trm5